jgi:hypothetical protein
LGNIATDLEFNLYQYQDPIMMTANGTRLFQPCSLYLEGLSLEPGKRFSLPWLSSEKPQASKLAKVHPSEVGRQTFLPIETGANL